MTNLFIKPGIKNFFVLLSIWYLFIGLYLLGSETYPSFGSLLVYYTKYSWPNFILSYMLFIYIIPYYLDERKYKWLIVAVILTMILFVGVRYLNNLYWQLDYYITWDRNLVPVKENPLTIFIGEFFRTIQFTLVPLAIRFYLEWRIRSEQKVRLEYDRINSELATLRYQLNPHFMLNAMNSIYYLSLVKSDQTPFAVMKLSEQLQYILYEKSDWVQLSKEIANLQAMIDFHQIRFPDNVVKFNVGISDMENSLMIPPLIFLTFAENAFKHGKPGTASVPVKFSIFISEGLLVYQVENHYEPPLEKGVPGGYGLENLKKRLGLLYMDKYSLKTVFGYGTYFAELKIPIEK